MFVRHWWVCAWHIFDVEEECTAAARKWCFCLFYFEEEWSNLNNPSGYLSETWFFPTLPARCLLEQRSGLSPQAVGKGSNYLWLGLLFNGIYSLCGFSIQLFLGCQKEKEDLGFLIRPSLSMRHQVAVLWSQWLIFCLYNSSLGKFQWHVLYSCDSQLQVGSYAKGHSNVLTWVRIIGLIFRSATSYLSDSGQAT